MTWRQPPRPWEALRRSSPIPSSAGTKRIDRAKSGNLLLSTNLRKEKPAVGALSAQANMIWIHVRDEGRTGSFRPPARMNERRVILHRTLPECATGPNVLRRAVCWLSSRPPSPAPGRCTQWPHRLSRANAATFRWTARGPVPSASRRSTSAATCARQFAGWRQRQSLPPGFLARLIWQESRFDPNAAQSERCRRHRPVHALHRTVARPCRQLQPGRCACRSPRPISTRCDAGSATSDWPPSPTMPARSAPPTSSTPAGRFRSRRPAMSSTSPACPSAHGRTRSRNPSISASTTERRFSGLPRSGRKAGGLADGRAGRPAETVGRGDRRQLLAGRRPAHLPDRAGRISRNY